MKRAFAFWSIWCAAFVMCCAMIVRADNLPLLGVGSGGGATGYQGPGDVTGWTTGAIAWYGLRGFNHSTTGKIFNVCDNATGTFCADATWSSAGGGTLTLPTINGNACDNSTHKCEIAIFYDQIGTACSGACDTSATHASSSRPLLLINCLGSLPCMLPNQAAPSNMSSANIASSTSQSYTSSVVALRTGTGQSTIASAGANFSEALFATATNAVAMYAGGSVPTASPANDNVVHDLDFLFANASSIIFIGNPSGTGGTSNNPVSISTANAIGSGAAFSFPSNLSGGLDGHVFEAGYWAGDKSVSSGFASMHTNQCSYYGYAC